MSHELCNRYAIHVTCPSRIRACKIPGLSALEQDFLSLWSRECILYLFHVSASESGIAFPDVLALSLDLPSNLYPSA